MKAVLEYLLPLPSVRRRQARIAVGLWLVSLLSTLILLANFHQRDSDGHPQAMAWILLYSVELLFVWWLYPAGSLLLAMDSHRLRIPGAAKQAFSSLPWFALACIAPASAGFQMEGISVWTSIPILLTACISGLLIAWLPRWATIALWLSPSIFSAVHEMGLVPRLSDSSIHVWLWTMPTISIGISIWMASRYIIHGMNETGISSPLIVQFRAAGTGWSGMASKRQLAMTSACFQPTIDLHRSGPGDPI